jgi:hypothetical protein
MGIPYMVVPFFYFFSESLYLSVIDYVGLNCGNWVLSFQ